MIEEEAQIIARVIATADGGCSHCVESLCEKLTNAELGFEFHMTGRNLAVQASWSDDPEDKETIPEVTVKAKLR